MIMRGDLEKIINQINPIFDNVFKQIEELRKELEALQKDKTTKAKPTKEAE